MSVGEISLSSSARTNLQALKSTSKLLSQTQSRLSSGKKVNTALDNATSYFASQGFLNSANDLSGLKDSMSTGLQTISSATTAISSIQTVVANMQAVLNSALQTTDATARSNYAAQYNALMTQLDGIVTDSTFNGTNLLDKSANLTVYFDSTNTTSLTVTGVNMTSAGLAITTAVGAFAQTSDIQAAQSLLQTALTTLRSNASQFGNNNTVVSMRSSFTDSMISTLQTASDNLVLADSNEEGANLQALQAQSSLGVVALGISGQQAQAILRLF